MKAKPTAVWITPSLRQSLRHFPAEVVILEVEPGIFDLPAALAEKNITPDIILQDELLQPRTLLKGLEEFQCPKVFWARDPHLNHYWQSRYAGLFGLVASTQKAQVEPLRQAGAAQAFWLTWSERLGPWTPFGQRATEVAFVGRITEYRPLRRMFVEYLQSLFPVRVETDIHYDQVQGVYAQTRLAPNESIQGEITQRLFATAAVGCLGLEPARDNGLDELFEPGKEVVRYGDGIELAEIIAHYLRHPDEAEKIGRAAWERAGREHTPDHRMSALAKLAFKAPAPGASGPEARRLFWLAAAHCLESGLMPGNVAEILAGLDEHPLDALCRTAALRLMVAGERPQQALALALADIQAGFALTDAPYQVSVSALALRQGEFALARSIFRTFLAATGQKDDAADSPSKLYAALGEVLARARVFWRPGFAFDYDRHLPAAASECFMLSLRHDPGNQPVLRRVEAMLRDLPGSELARLGFLSELSLRNREDYRLTASLGLTNLKAFRVREGLEELRQAGELAARQGKTAGFERFMATQDPSGRIRARLNPLLEREL